MGKLVRSCFCLVASLIITPAAASFAAPVKDQGRVLIRVEGHEETFGIISFPFHWVGDYTLAVTTLGEGVLTFLARNPGAPGEGADDPPRATAIRFRLDAGERARLRDLLEAARIGRQGDCFSHVPFFAYGSASLPPRQRLVWFGQQRRHEFAAWEGSQCSDEVVALLRHLAAMAEAAYALPTER